MPKRGAVSEDTGNSKIGLTERLYSINNKILSNRIISLYEKTVISITLFYLVNKRFLLRSLSTSECLDQVKS